MEYICNDCPRKCGAKRDDTHGDGFCQSPSLPALVRAAPHFGEEPCISGTKGAGTLFFSGCNLRCVFCQNHEISRRAAGRPLTAQSLRDVMLRLRDEGVHNIELVTPTHYSRMIARALDGTELGIPVIWNSSGYESVETLKCLEGLIQVYMPDLKYMDAELARRYSSAPDYPEAASRAIREMFRQTGPFRINEDGLLVRGVLIRHLILPGRLENTRDVIDFAADCFPKGSVLFSLMGQYTPIRGALGHLVGRIPELSRAITPEENAEAIHYLHARHIESGYWQEVEASGTEQIPDFEDSGLDF